MKTKTDELLWMLCWTCDMLSRPTFRNLTDSFESWAYRNGFSQQCHRLEKGGYLERQPGLVDGRLHRLSEAGRVQALGGRDPVERWKRRWDGRWRLVLFDVPEQHRVTRNRLRRYLQRRGFGYLQKSVWVTPDPVTDQRAVLAGGPVDVESLLLLEARPGAAESDEQIVAGAWDFAAINRCYAAHEKVLIQRPIRRLDSSAAARTFLRWAREEQEIWQAAMNLDPLLPKALLPDDYRGWAAWQRRCEELSGAGQQMRGFVVD